MFFSVEIVEIRYGFNILLTKDKIGIDGPMKFNWGVKSKWLGFGKVEPKEALNLKNLIKIKSETKRLFDVSRLTKK